VSVSAGEGVVQYAEAGRSSQLVAAGVYSVCVWYVPNTYMLRPFASILTWQVDRNACHHMLLGRVWLVASRLSMCS
jgi:hypothetical protein